MTPRMTTQITTSHRWFRSGGYSLLGHLDAPEPDYPMELGTRGLGVLMVPPFGWEDVCSYRPLRMFAQSLASAGIPTFRFDLPATGDSSGTAQDPHLVEAWIQSIEDAANELRRVAGIDRVAIVGIRLGGVLAVAAAARGANLQDLVLWGPAATGRALLRELRAFRNMEVPEFSDGQAAPTPPFPGMEVAGYLLSPETLASLEALDLTSPPPMPNRRVLILSRDEFPSDAKLVRALESSGCKVEAAAGHGYGLMMTLPHEVMAPMETCHLVRDWLTDGPHRSGDAATKPDGSSERNSYQKEIRENSVSENISTENVSTEIPGPGVRESIFLIPRSHGTNFGVLSEPNTVRESRGQVRGGLANDYCVLLLNPGAARHIGPNRMWVDAARRWAAAGISSLRVDLEGIGESDGEQNLNVEGLYHEQLVEQIEQAMEALRSRTGASRFVAVGLCSGAFWAFHAAVRNSSVCGAVLLNPRLFFWDPAVDRRRDIRRTVGGLSDSAAWRRLVRGEVEAKRIKVAVRLVLDKFRGSPETKGKHSQIPVEAMAQARAEIQRHGTSLTLVFTEGEPLLREMEEEGHLPPPGAATPFRCIRIANGGHTFRPLWAQKMVHDLIDRELETIAKANGSVQGDMQAQLTPADPHP